MVRRARASGRAASLVCLRNLENLSTDRRIEQGQFSSLSFVWAGGDGLMLMGRAGPRAPARGVAFGDLSAHGSGRRGKTSAMKGRPLTISIERDGYCGLEGENPLCGREGKDPRRRALWEKSFPVDNRETASELRFNLTWLLARVSTE